MDRRCADPPRTLQCRSALQQYCLVRPSKSRRKWGNTSTDVLPTKIGWLRHANWYLVQIGEKLLTRRGAFKVPDKPSGTCVFVRRHYFPTEEQLQCWVTRSTRRATNTKSMAADAVLHLMYSQSCTSQRSSLTTLGFGMRPRNKRRP